MNAANPGLVGSSYQGPYWAVEGDEELSTFPSPFQGLVGGGPLTQGLSGCAGWRPGLCAVTPTGLTRCVCRTVRSNRVPEYGNEREVTPRPNQTVLSPSGIVTTPWRSD